MRLLSLILIWTWLAGRAHCVDSTALLTQLPACASPCLVELMTKSTCGVDIPCLCADPLLKTDVMGCVKSNCEPIQMLTTMNVTSTACEYPVRDKHHSINIMITSIITISGVVVGLRFYDKLVYKSGLHLDDYLIFGCLLLAIANSTVVIYGLSEHGLGQDIWLFGPGTITTYLKYLYVGQALYATETFTIKICVLSFYLRIFPGNTTRMIIWSTIGVSVICMIIFDILAIAQCRPISYFWQGWDGLHEGQCIGVNPLAWAIAAIGIILDLWMLGIPLSEVLFLQMNWRRKVAVSLMFIVGTFVTVVSVLRLRYLVEFGKSTNPTWDGYDTCYWSAIEVNVGIWCACMPNIRMLLINAFPRLRSSAGSRPSNALSGSSGERYKGSSSHTARSQNNNKFYQSRPAQMQNGEALSSTVDLVEMLTYTKHEKSLV
ncbi:uncharacterized protein B0J16DRAFT_346139 [Fusarium flagelliforme]|uniref:uncharacterized protein n=1 Tax=Fusarium flagelliforme TaxID=2675880 RepID=UPI001E8E147E|nr:uncharacterized protein B0J16DRAFT_346139 [Fusarium flagelliforme]KAH7178966.1 hypothetical protein B0J16DRAFT_346139 [Fusarium flagelliforme]